MNAQQIAMLESARSIEAMMKRLGQERFTASRGPVSVIVDGLGQLLDVTMPDPDQADMMLAAWKAASGDAQVRQQAVLQGVPTLLGKVMP